MVVINKLKECDDLDRIILMMAALISGGVGMSIILTKFFIKKWVWYIPSIIMLLVISYILLKIYSEKMEGYVELGYNIRILMMAAVMSGNLMTNLIISHKRRAKSSSVE